MNKPKLLWWVSLDQENYEPAATRKKAEAIAVSAWDAGEYWIGQGYQAEIDLAAHFDASEWIISLCEGPLEDVLDPENGDLDLDLHAINNLELQVRAAIRKWQRALSEKPQAWAITWVIHPEKVVVGQ
jgi:hypothetical protein